jgi:hypothetical protein
MAIWNERITLGIVKPKEYPKDVREMRKAIQDAARDSYLIRNALDSGRYMGLNGEDTYTLLAYHALIELERHFQVNMDYLNVMPSPPFIVKDTAGKGGVESEG